MDAIVNKIIVKDPALIKHEGNNLYSFRIYPVAIGKSRKVRILYTIPLQSDSIFKMDIKSAFTIGCKVIPKNIPVKFIQGENSNSNYIFSYGSVKKKLQFNALYSIPSESFYSGLYYNGINQAKTISIIPMPMNKAFMYNDNSTDNEVIYFSIFSTVPDTLDKLITTFLLQDYTIEATIVTKKDVYIYDLDISDPFNFYIKSDSKWNRKIIWNVYNKDGSSEINYEEEILTDSTSDYNNLLPLLWASEKTLIEKSTNLGKKFGFVDDEMSLIAIERDTLSAENTMKYWDNGMPLLLPEEIISDTIFVANSNTDNNNNLTLNVNTTPINHDILQKITLEIGANNRVKINLNDIKLKRLTIEVYDLKGKLIKVFSNLNIKNYSTSISLPKNLNGMFIMQIRSDDIQISKKLMLK